MPYDASRRELRESRHSCGLPYSLCPMTPVAVSCGKAVILVVSPIPVQLTWIGKQYISVKVLMQYSRSPPAHASRRELREALRRRLAISEVERTNRKVLGLFFSRYVGID